MAPSPPTDTISRVNVPPLTPVVSRPPRSVPVEESRIRTCDPLALLTRYRWLDVLLYARPRSVTPEVMNEYPSAGDSHPSPPPNVVFAVMTAETWACADAASIVAPRRVGVMNRRIMIWGG